MGLKENATMTFMDYQVEDGGIRLHFLCPDPGPGEASDYFVLVTDDELSGISSLPELKQLVTAKLERALRATNIASKLDGLIGQSLTI